MLSISITNDSSFKILNSEIKQNISSISDIYNKLVNYPDLTNQKLTSTSKAVYIWVFIRVVKILIVKTQKLNFVNFD